jgi:hypothetical protein
MEVFTPETPEVAMWQRPDQDQDPDATVEFPAVTDDPPGWHVRGGQSADGWVEIVITELAEGELLSGEDGGEPADVTQRPA